MRLWLVVWVVAAAVVGRPPPASSRPQALPSSSAAPLVGLVNSATGDKHSHPPHTTPSLVAAEGVGARQEVVHAEELLEKYGYLDCVPAGSENTTHLHRLLLHRRQHPSPPHDPLSTITRSFRHDPHHLYAPDRGLRISGVTEAVAALSSSQGGGRSWLPVWDQDHKQWQYLPVCASSDIQRAIKRFQAAYRLGEGGALDGATMGLLASPRCGNPDDLAAQPRDTDPGTTRILDDVTAGSGRKRSRRSLADEQGGEEVGLTPTGVGVGPPLRRSGRLPDPDLLQKVAAQARKETWRQLPQPDQHTEGLPDPQAIVVRRRRWVQEQAARVESGTEDRRLAALLARLPPQPARAPARVARSTHSSQGHYLPHPVIRWRLVTAGYSSQLGVTVQRAALALAFRMWAEVIPPVFLEDSSSDARHLHVVIGFGKRSHLGCITEFDGLGGELGHTLTPAPHAQIHMDDDEHFTLDSDHGTNLLKVAVHEIGHVLGLGHVVRNESVMYPVYEQVLPNIGLELGPDDRQLVQQLYGSCVGAFDTVLDLLRWTDFGLTYNTYFFRGASFWMYENRYNRTRLGDPLYVTQEWGGLPPAPDGYAHVWTRDHKLDYHLFFKGREYYLYDAASGRVAPGFPRLIAHDFSGPPTPRRPEGRTIPDNIDTVYFDKRDENLYFFKGKRVYGYDVSKGSLGCCLPGYPRRIHREYPTLHRNARRLPKALDAAYYSYSHQKLFFIKDRLYWEVAGFHPNDAGRNNSVVGPFFVHHNWRDICDTELDPYDAYAYSVV